jgi:GntR family transcriptional regulator
VSSSSGADDVPESQVAQRGIGSGQYRPDTRIPAESELVEEFEVARSTARRAVSVLREEELIYTVPTRGGYVSRQAS